VSAILGRPAEGLWLGTFHAFCARMLRRHAGHPGLSENFTILDSDDQVRLLRQVMEAARVDVKRWVPRRCGGDPALEGSRLTPDRITPAEDIDFAGGRARDPYAAYQARLRALNAADFGHLLLYVTELLRTQPDIHQQYHRMCRYILVDEYQDTNLIQYLWLRLLAQSHRTSAPAWATTISALPRALKSPRRMAASQRLNWAIATPRPWVEELRGLLPLSRRSSRRSGSDAWRTAHATLTDGSGTRRSVLRSSSRSIERDPG